MGSIDVARSGALGTLAGGGDPIPQLLTEAMTTTSDPNWKILFNIGNYYYQEGKHQAKKIKGAIIAIAVIIILLLVWIGIATSLTAAGTYGVVHRGNAIKQEDAVITNDVGHPTEVRNPIHSLGLA